MENKTFFYQTNPEDSTNRAFLDDHLHEGHELLEQVQAPTWLAAKEQLFPSLF